MLIDFLIWLYFANALLLMSHEIDSAYWKEWNLFGLKGGMNGFLVFNIIAIALVLYGFMEIIKETSIGVWFSLLLGITGIFTFGIHAFYLAKGRSEFRVPFSLFILISIFIISLIELGFSVYAII